ncbi:hypothetical protein ACFL45_06400 [Candidatus Neomarinimicrobiota bacterium]
MSRVQIGYHPWLSFLILLAAAGPLCPQASKDRSEPLSSLPKPAAIIDRAAGIHDAGNIGMFFENRGKLYPRRAADGPYGEFPINSGKHYIYRINPMVGVAADSASGREVNVMQGRYTTNEEWEAAAGYHNPNLAKVAFSDDPITWPLYGWPVQDSAGNPIIISDQDSYCVFNDSNNTVQVLGVEVIQTGYVFASRFAEDIIFYTYELINKGNYDLDGVYFNWYFDCDVGDGPGGESEYTDDLLGFDADMDLVYMYDADGYSADWGGATGYFGSAFLQTPEVDGSELGITDLHYNEYYDDLDEDSVQYSIFSSDLSYMPTDIDEGKYFHSGTAGNIHLDDLNTIPAGGNDLLANISSGPYEFSRGDTLTFVIAVLAGIDLNDLYLNLDAARSVINSGWNPPKPPPSPALRIEPGDGWARLFWVASSERVIDQFSGEMDFEGYRIYKSIDRGASWDQIDRNVNPTVGELPIPFADFDIVNGIGSDAGLQYSIIDTNVTNGFEYWYSLTAYDRGTDFLESLESPIGKKLESSNTVSVVPRSDAIGYLPVRSDEVQHLGMGRSNYVLEVEPVDEDSLSGHQYDIGFTYLVNRAVGDLNAELSIIVADSALTAAYQFTIEFISDTRFVMKNLSTGEDIGRDTPYKVDYVYSNKLGYGLDFIFHDPAEIIPPETGDAFTISFAVNVVKDGVDTLIQGRPFALNRPYATDDGVIFTLWEADDTLDVSPPPVENFDLTFSVDDSDQLLDTTYTIIITEAGQNIGGAPFISLDIMYDSAEVFIVGYTEDSLLISDIFTFDGIAGTVEALSSEDLPPEGTIIGLRAVPSVMPNLQDAYRVGLLGSAADRERIDEEIEKVRVVPNPYVVSSLWEQEFGELRAEPIRQIQFINLPPVCKIHIFTIAGDRLKTIEHDGSDGTETWDLRAESGREIATGIYLYLVKTDDSEYLDRFAVIK